MEQRKAYGARYTVFSPFPCTVHLAPCAIINPLQYPTTPVNQTPFSTRDPLIKSKTSW
jgi:hypothetical protein